MNNDDDDCPDPSELIWPDDTSKQLVDAVGDDSAQPPVESDRESALLFWRAIARGNIGPEEMFWVRHVACRILKADREKNSKRANAILIAVGLSGGADRWARLRETAAALRDFGATREEILEYLQREGLVHLETVDARSLLDRELRKDRTANSR